MPLRIPGVGLALAALLAGTAVAAAPGAGADEPTATDYALTIDPTGSGPALHDWMYGAFLEDINHAADGGLYAELVQNRSFEYGPADHPDFTPLTAWETTATGGATGGAEVVDDDGRLNENNRAYLRLDLHGDGDGPDAGFGVENSGFHGGIEVRDGASYTFSVWARTDQPDPTPLTVTLRDAAGEPLAEELRLEVSGGAWEQYTGTLTAEAGAADGRLAVTAGGAGSLALDMVSLFPEETFRDRPNGLRPDLAQLIADLEPGFLRFPGGCLVNTGSHEAYEAPNFERERAYQWKETVGPVEERPTNHNFWGYNQSYGLGYFEYFQFAEDIGADPLPVVPALVTGCGENEAVDDPALLQRHIQDTLDLVEFANGPADSPWGAVRAEMGHPEPFGLTHVQVGNEENLGEEFFERFTAFRAAIEAEHPEITVVGNSGPASSGANFDRLWELNREAGVELVDEHYYNSPQWFLENNERYDAYDREGPAVLLGEYGSQDNRYANALAEAAYMTGLERNADVLLGAAYAPLLAHVDGPQWEPDLIWFDNARAWGSASYEVQRLFATQAGDEVVPSEASGTPGIGGPITGAVGLSTWATAAAYDDVRVTSADGETLFADDFSDGDAAWTHESGAGSWAVEDGAYVQSDTAAENTLVTAGDPTWTDYDLELTATKRAGDEGFLIGFGVEGSDDLYWWNLGGWGNTASGVERTTDGAKQTLLQDDTTIEEGREYEIRIEVRGERATLFLDGEEWGSFTDDAAAEPFRQSVTRDATTGELVVKVVNAQADEAVTEIDLGPEVDLAPTAEVTSLQGEPDAVNTAEDRPIQPETSEFDGVDSAFSYTFPAHSVTFLRLQPR